MTDMIGVSVDSKESKVILHSNEYYADESHYIHCEIENSNALVSMERIEHLDPKIDSTDIYKAIDDYNRTHSCQIIIQ